MAIGKDAIELQSVIGYSFSDISYLECALTHSSYTNEQRLRGIKAPSNERLEFFGDAILQFVVSEYLYSSFTKYREGALTKMRQQLVCEKTLAKIAAELNVGDYINVGHGEEMTDCRKRPKILADALEALIGAVYLDSTARGSTEYKRVVVSIFEKEITALSANQKTDYKTMLQQLAEQDGTAILEYRVAEERGPEHKKTFRVEAFVNNNKVGEGTAHTKKQAEMEAARVALKLFGVSV